MPVSVLACINYPGHIVAQDKAKGTWKVRCDSSKDESWVSADDLKRVCTAQDVAVSEKYFVGKWDLFTGGGAAYYERGGSIYRTAEAAVRTPPLTINADGTYVWPVDSKTTIKGKWRLLQKNEYKYPSDKAPVILLIAAEGGKDWQVTRQGTNGSDNRDRVLVERKDLGLTYRGPRIP
jgi:hypothetical protein